MEFEWDPEKASKNEKKHDVAFQEAASVFGDPLAIVFPDPDHSGRESRWLTFGTSSLGRILVVSHADWEHGTRIVTARKATKHERKIYEEG